MLFENSASSLPTTYNIQLRFLSPWSWSLCVKCKSKCDLINSELVADFKQVHNSICYESPCIVTSHWLQQMCSASFTNTRSSMKHFWMFHYSFINRQQVPFCCVWSKQRNLAAVKEWIIYASQFVKMHGSTSKSRSKWFAIYLGERLRIIHDAETIIINIFSAKVLIIYNPILFEYNLFVIEKLCIAAKPWLFQNTKDLLPLNMLLRAAGEFYISICIYIYRIWKTATKRVFLQKNFFTVNKGKTNNNGFQVLKYFYYLLI